MFSEIEKLFSKRENKIIGEYEKSAVIVFLIEEKGEVYILFEVRSLNLASQPGDVSLPGGRIERGEEIKDAAIREAIEELNVKKEDIDILGAMDYFVSPYNMIIYPFVARLKVKDVHPNKDEVNHVFKVPINYFMENEPEGYKIKIISQLPKDFPYHLIIGGKDYKFKTGNMKQYFYQYNGYVIWGFTALIIKNFVNILKENLEEIN
ncbi:8-oxo-dGTP pyrophosphatase MutT (NUDIX family) [Clostridium tetanomorphum]|uniref:CoA pyrophosphatase n=1 Tax=Clostridium tetanomorphum TaxID=1553 RepID=A0A923E787_CLOTT|nr:CoA pyrophosphatase [Clostridium tetanomorphum]KAJ49484.1 phosphohydrolase (mutT family protein) [Clostridium tetanomorphum DSM 665]KAJ51439.1 phosphohydrolase (mutT family protein) [Clostridium tetanomorphum DSM 665]MBC2396532.1 CoA pyrophosphatase [Clostridium tetanomorphum]MBP1863858.1 8-oxo-dGTP pyrophosphatase MutT (NUDIX family) [Clostridium tetanomorphum]NRS84936.1 8-oxo-dGTP pyrophosphatase MutT (NUDIX family) [Clostridium tetanomorphum]